MGRKKKVSSTKKEIKSISQLEIAKEIAREFNLTIEQVLKIVDMEQRKTMEYVKKGYKVIKKNYLTLTPISKDARTIHSALTNQDYEVKAKMIVRVSVGEGFKSFINVDRPMKDKLCRFVNSSNDQPQTEKSN